MQCSSQVFECRAFPTAAAKSQSQKPTLLPPIPQTLFLLQSRSAPKSVLVYGSPILLVMGAPQSFARSWPGLLVVKTALHIGSDCPTCGKGSFKGLLACLWRVKKRMPGAAVLVKPARTLSSKSLGARRPSHPPPAACGQPRRRRLPRRRCSAGPTGEEPHEVWRLAAHLRKPGMPGLACGQPTSIGGTVSGFHPGL